MATLDPIGLRRAALLSCGLFIAEDPAVVALRDRLTSSSHRPLATTLAVDVGLAGAMVAYNFAAARFVVARAGSERVMAAIEQVSAEQPATALHRWLRRANPFAWAHAAVGCSARWRR